MNGRKYEERDCMVKCMAASVSQNGRFRAVFLSVIMVLMTQVGYTDNMDFSIGLNQDTESKDTGGSTPALTPSVEGADLLVGDLMTNITFQYKEDYNGNGTAWVVKDIFDDYALGNHSTLYFDSMHVSSLEKMNNVIYFAAADWDDLELWRSDGTESGTYMVKNIRSNNTYLSLIHI